MNQLLKTLYKYNRLVSVSDTTSLSYYLILSIIPILTLMVISFNYLRFDIAVVKDTLLKYFSNELTTLLINYLEDQSAGYFSAFAIVMSLVVSSRGVFRLKQVTNRLYEVPKEQHHFVRSRIYAIFNTMTFVLFSAIMVMAFGILPSLTFILDWLNLEVFSHTLITLSVIYVLMLFINMIVPSLWPGFKAGSLGALVSTAGMAGIMIFIRFFRNAATYDTIYGPLASVAWILITLNWMSNVIYFGICFSSVIYLEDKEKEADHEK